MQAFRWGGFPTAVPETWACPKPKCGGHIDVPSVVERAPRDPGSRYFIQAPCSRCGTFVVIAHGYTPQEAEAQIQALGKHK